jgi:F0F1-type ATP synthase assembly protein I
MSSLKNNKTLTERIDIAISKEGKIKDPNSHNKSFVNIFSRVATELLAGLMIGAGIGWTIDQWLETTPWFLIVFFSSWWSSWYIKPLESGNRKGVKNWIF